MKGHLGEGCLDTEFLRNLAFAEFHIVFSSL